MPKTLTILCDGPYDRQPLGCIAAVGGCVVALQCPFDETVGEYRDYFDVSLIVSAAPHEVSLETFRPANYPHVCLGQLPVAECQFRLAFSLQSAALENRVKVYQDRKEV